MGKIRREGQPKYQAPNTLTKIWDFRINFPDSFIRATPYILFSIFSFLLYSLSRIGADFNKYIEWANAFSLNDIFELGGDTLSPMGIPVSQWNFGLGLLFSLGKGLPGSLSNSGALFMGWIFAIIFWWAFLGLLYHASRKNILLTFFGASIAFIGTPLGYYSLSYSTESFSFTCLAVIAYWLISNKKWRIVDVLLIGVLSGILIIIRLPLAIFLVPIYLALCYLVFTVNKTDSLAKKFFLLSISVIPVLICVVGIGFSNRWMTGSVIGSPYNFGSDTFRSLDWSNPVFHLRLFHPCQGLLIYHPLFLFLLAALFFLIIRKCSIYNKIFFSIILLVFALNLYLYSSFTFGWWCGGSFGQRVLAINAVILIPALIYFLATKKQGKISNAIWFLLIFLSCLWSYFLLFGGCTEFYIYKSLLTFQVSRIKHLLSLDFFSPLVGVLLFAKITNKFKNKNNRPAYLPYMITLLFFYFAFYFLLDWHAPDYPSAFHLDINMIIILALKTVLIISIPLFLNNILLTKDSFFYDQNNRILRGIKIFMPILFLTIFCSITYTFTRFAIRTEDMIKQGTFQYKKREFTYLSTIDIPEVWTTYYGYLNQRGFEDKKKAFYDFIVQLDKKARNDLKKFMEKHKKSHNN